MTRTKPPPVRLCALVIGSAATIGIVLRLSATASGTAPLVPRPTAPSPSVIQHHNGPSRDGVYVESSLTPLALAGLHLDPAFHPAIRGPVYAQPLYLDDVASGHGTLYVATEQNLVYAIDAVTGAVRWQTPLGVPAGRGRLPCGNIDPLGVTGTPIIDVTSRTVFVDAMTAPEGSTTTKHMVFGLSVDDGSVRTGWPVDVAAALSSAGMAFDSAVQNQRGALAILGHTLFVPYGGHFGDCGDYRGWVVGFPLDRPVAVRAFATRAHGGGMWAPGGISSDGASLFVATGNTMGATTWSGGEAVIRLAPDLRFTGTPADFFAPLDWKALDNGDVDLGGTGAIQIDVPGATPRHLVVAMGKNGKIYLLDRANLGGIGNGLFNQHIASGPIIDAPAAYTTDRGTFLVFKGAGIGCAGGTDLTAVRITPSPLAFGVAWCAHANSRGSPMVTTTDGHAGFVVWTAGADGDGRLRAFDGDTGHVLYAGGAATDGMNGIARFQTPIVAHGKIYVAGENRLYAFAVK